MIDQYYIFANKIVFVIEYNVVNLSVEFLLIFIYVLWSFARQIDSLDYLIFFFEQGIKGCIVILK